MKNVLYLIQAISIYFFFFVCKIIGYKNSSNLGAFLGKKIGPFFRSKKILQSNLKKAFSNISEKEINKISRDMWENYGRILAEYVFIKKFRNSELKDFITIDGEEIFLKIKEENNPVIFISGHFNNFELLAMMIERYGIDLAAIYRPLNNHYLNKTMVNLRKKYICKKQIPKGISGVKDMAYQFKNGTSLALMIDQRVSQGARTNFFSYPAHTTTLPAQFIKKYNCKVVPVYIERSKKFYFNLKVDQPIKFNENDSIEKITLSLNNWLEKKITQNPTQWIWSHNRWK